MVSRRTLLGATTAAALPVPLMAEPALADVPLDNQMTTDAQWADFLRGQDLLWRNLPADFKSGPFLGDGRLGTMIYKEPNRNQIRFTVQHAEVQDHRPQYGNLFGLARLPVGHLTLEPVGTISSVNWRQSLWDAELTGTVTTASGTLTLQAFIHDQILVVNATASGGEQVRWTFHPEEAISPRAATETPPAGYTGHPAPTLKTTGDVRQVIQNLLGGGQTATAYRQVGSALFVTVAHSFPGTTAEATCLARAQNAVFSTLLNGNRAWWHAFYRKSFISIPDQRLQAFHWIQLFKAAAGTRSGGPVMATTGPWLEPTPWPGVWWNLNVQLEYWLIHGSNHLELDAITTTLQSNAQQLINNVGSAYRADSNGLGRSSDMFCQRSVGTPGTGAEVGDLTWALHNVWLSYRHTMDDNMLRDVLFPLLRRSINYYRHFLTTDGSGRLHLPTTLSPEYPTTAPDCNYDLSLIRWGCQTLIDSATRLGINDSLIPTWRNILTNLTPHPTDSNGFMIGAGVPYAQSHRHYSHLLMIYPLYLVNWDQPANRTLIETSIVRWHALTGAHRGYSYTGAASMYAMMGRGDTALNYLMRFFDPSTSFPCLPNTMYTEAGPVVETPLSASQSIHDMVCQSWGGVVRVFPAIPSSWADVTLHDFRTQGAFLVSASRRGGTTRFVRVRSLTGEPLRLKHGIAGGNSVVYQAEDATISQGVVESNHAGFTGTGFVNVDNVVGSYVQFNVTSATTRTATLRLRFANGTTAARPMSLFVNGSVGPGLNFAPTGAWPNWAVESVNNTVRVTSTLATGGPNLDSLTVEFTPQVVSYQAENATISQGVVESNHAGFTGTGFVNGDNVVGSYVQFAVNAAAAGPSTLVFRYANGTTTDRPMAVTVNGSSAGTLAFPPTGAWPNWSTASVGTSLVAGANTVRVTSTTANGGPNLDRLDVVPPSPLSVTLDDGSAASWRDIGDGVIEIDLASGREALVHAAGPTPPLTIAPVPISIPGAAWGLP
jgi:alpha-L-fucosidase 2